MKISWAGPGAGQVVVQRELEDPDCPREAGAGHQGPGSSFICSECPGLILTWDCEESPALLPLEALEASSTPPWLCGLRPVTTPL